MITPKRPLAPDVVGRHYDDLDRFYRELWGEHVHHGLWTTGHETPAEAVVALARRVADRSRATPASRVCDVGCGYGGTARLLATERGCEVTALTVSRAQYAHAVQADPFAHNPTYLLRDWLDNRLPDGAFDAAIAIESTEHMADKRRCMAEIARVLRPGGRAVVCAWLAAEHPTRAQVRHLLEPICREGRLPGMGTESEYRVLMEEAGLAVHEGEDLSHQVARTWPVCIRRLAGGLVREPSYRAFLLRSRSEDRVFALTMVRLWLAYRTGAMRYLLFVARKPA